MLSNYIRLRVNGMKKIMYSLYSIIALAILLIIICAYIQTKGYVDNMIMGYTICFCIIGNAFRVIIQIKEMEDEK